MRDAENTLRQLLEVGRSLVGEMDPELVLERVLAGAREATGARYAAIGVLNDERTELERFVTAGIAPEAHREIGELPRGRGVLGVLIEHPEILRLDDVGTHPESYGFPSGHPPMTSFLGAPILIRGRSWGNLYLTEKEGGEDFTDDDELAIRALADWAATAIENARLFHSSEQRREQLERAVRGLEAAHDIADATGSGVALERILELIVKRGRALVDARSVLIMLREGEHLVVSAAAGHVSQAEGRRVPISASTSGQVLEGRRPLRIADVSAQLRIRPNELGVSGAQTALLVPMIHRDTAIGVLAAFDRGSERDPFTGTDEQLLRTFAAAGTNAVALRRSVEADRLRSAIDAADLERGRWARELHDQTLQALGGLRVLLASSLRQHDDNARESAVRQAIEDIELEIGNLRAIIADLRPSLLDDLGLVPALHALLERRRGDDLEIESRIDVPEGSDLRPELETTAYRLVQEALTNVVKHAEATTVTVIVELEADYLRVEVRDDGRGFDTSSRASGFGLDGMRERVFLAGGTLAIASGGGGTTVSAELRDVRWAGEPSAQQFVS